MTMGWRTLVGRVIFVSTLLAFVAVAHPGPVSAAVGDALRPPITPTAATTADGDKR